MQVRRLRFDTGRYSIVGQIINVPVDVQNMVSTLPRALSEDEAFNVSLKKHIIHKSSAYVGLVKRGEVKAWLDHLQTTQPYIANHISIDWSRFSVQDSGVLEAQEIEEIENESEAELLLAQQQTVLWNEDKCLCIAPGQTSIPCSLLYDEYAEELSFPDIYYGVLRVFSPELRVTWFMMMTSEVRRKDRRGAGPEHILYMVVKVLRYRVSRGLYSSFRFAGNTSEITRRMLEAVHFSSSV